MKEIRLLPFGRIDAALLSGLRDELAREFGAPCEILQAAPEPACAYNPERQQYWSTRILAAMAEQQTPASTRLLGIISADLYIPILTFVFGEAQLNGTCAVASTFRLRQEFYGLPVDGQLFLSRLVKECVHELGHSLGIAHCENYECAMAPSHSVEWVDLKRASICESCRASAGIARPRRLGSFTSSSR